MTAKIAILLAAIALPARASAGQFALDRLTIAAGGGTGSSEHFTATITVGQAAASAPAQADTGPFSMDAGFWSEPIVTDASDSVLPTLTVVGDGAGGILLSWPSVSGWVLQQSADLGGSTWSDVQAPPADDGVTRSLRIATDGAGLFLRLKK